MDMKTDWKRVSARDTKQVNRYKHNQGLRDFRRTHQKQGIQMKTNRQVTKFTSILKPILPTIAVWAVLVTSARPALAQFSDWREEYAYNLVADLTLDIQALKALNSKNFLNPR